MAIGKINPFNNMNMSAMAATKPIKTSEAAGTVASGISQSQKGFEAVTKKSNLFAGNTAGVNEAMNGQSMNTMAMAGKNAGIAGGKLNLIG